MRQIEIEVAPQEEGLRLDALLAKATGFSRSESQRLLQDGNVLVNEKQAAKSYRVLGGDLLCVTVPPPTPIEAQPQDIPLDIVYEDDALLVVNKPKGMVVHPAPGNPDGTLVNTLLHHCKGSLSGIGGEIRPGIVHRIDKDTSGLLVVAKNDEAHQNLAQQFACHSLTREYQAVVHGGFKIEQGSVHAPIGRNPADRKKMAVTEKNAKDAITHYTVLARYTGFTHLALKLQTGRTHQIRVHMAHIGHPVAGDEVYGPRKKAPGLQGQCLHAKTLGFVHPISGKQMFFTSELPEYFTKFLARVSPD